jgi:diguanylate cyclase (GGDEF)-like protein
VTLSLGVASTFPQPATSQENLLAAADRALYQAKDKGRDRVILDADGF